MMRWGSENGLLSLSFSLSPSFLGTHLSALTFSICGLAFQGSGFVFLSLKRALVSSFGKPLKPTT